MNKEQITILLKSVKSGDLNIEDAVNKLRALPYDDLGFAKIDTHRNLRRGFPEVIFCQGKTVEQVVAIVENMMKNNDNILAMRASKDQADAVSDVAKNATYHPLSKVLAIGEKPEPKTKGKVMVIAAGTADLSVAEEAALTVEMMGNQMEQLSDVGVAGVHRLLKNVELVQSARVLIVVAGMEGALPGVVAGLVDKPVIAVPTSIGYGASFGGISALLTMLNSCAPGIGVVNIDNGFGAGYMASLINHLE